MSVEAFEILFAGNLPSLLPDEISQNSKAKDVGFNIYISKYLCIYQCLF